MHAGHVAGLRRRDRRQAEKLVEPVANSRLRATPAGRLVLNALVAELAA